MAKKLDKIGRKSEKKSSFAELVELAFCNSVIDLSLVTGKLPRRYTASGTKLYILQN